MPQSFLENRSIKLGIDSDDILPELAARLAVFDISTAQNSLWDERK